MNVVNLNEVLLSLESGSRPKGGASLLDNGILSIGAQHLDREGGFNLSSPKFIPETYYSNMKTGIISKDVILIVKDGATTGKVSYVGCDFKKNKSSINEHLFLLRIDQKKAIPKYVFYYLFSKKGQFQILKNFRGATVGGINRSFTKDVSFSLPPIAEQKRIATILDKADSIRKKRQEAIKLTEELLRSQFLEMFGDPVTNPKCWEIKPMNEVIENIQAGLSMKAEERKYEGDEWGVLKVSAVTSGRFKANEHKAVGNPNFTKSPIIPQKGDLLFSRANTRELVAATCLVENNYDRLFLPDKLWRIISNKKLATVEYLKFLLSDPKFRGLLARKATGTSGSMLNVSQAKLLEMNAPIPELDIQKKFTVFVWKTFEFRKKQELALAEINSLFNSLLQKAFKGEL